MSTSTTSPVQTSRRAGREQRPSAGPSAILFVVLAAQLMAVIDLNIVNVAVPTIQLDLHASGAELQLIVAGYVITYAMTLITGARLGDRFGHGRVFRVGLTVFTVASLLCGLAGSSGELIGFRFAQGVGAGVLIPQVMSLIQRTFTGTARLKALGLYSAVIALGAVIGQVAGGALVSANLFGSTWRSVFLLNVPIGIVLLVFALRWLPVDRGESARQLDPAGVTILSAAVLAVVLPLVLGHEESWPLWCWLSIGGGVILLAVFVAVERRVGQRGGSPLVAGRVIRAPGMISGGATVLLTMLGFGGFLFSLTLYLQGALHVRPLEAGLLFAPAALGTTITSLNWQRLPARWHSRIVPIGLVGCTVAYGLLAPIDYDGHRHIALLIIDFFAVGFFFGMSYSPVIGMTLRNVPVADAADASGVLITLLQLGQVLGVAILGTLYLTLAAHHPAAHAAAITVVAVAGCSLIAAGAGLALVRRRAT